MVKRSFERAKVNSRDVRLCKSIALNEVKAMNDDELRQQEIKNEFLVIKALMKCPSDKNAQKAITKHKAHLNSLLRIKSHV